MNIFELEEKLDLIDDDRYVNILQLVIEAVNDYPTDVLDTEDYFKEIKRLLGKAEITLSELKLLSDKVGPGAGFGEHWTWIAESVAGLLEVFDIMRIHKITFTEVLEKIESLK